MNKETLQKSIKALLAANGKSTTSDLVLDISNVENTYVSPRALRERLLHLCASNDIVGKKEGRYWVWSLPEEDSEEEILENLEKYCLKYKRLLIRQVKELDQSIMSVQNLLEKIR